MSSPFDDVPAAVRILVPEVGDHRALSDTRDAEDVAAVIAYHEEVAVRGQGDGAWLREVDQARDGRMQPVEETVGVLLAHAADVEMERPGGVHEPDVPVAVAANEIGTVGPEGEAAGLVDKALADEPTVFSIKYKDNDAQPSDPDKETRLFHFSCSAAAYNESSVYYMTDEVSGVQQLQFAEPKMDIRYENNDSDGKLLGITMARMVKNRNPVGVILPASDILEIAEQAKNARAEEAKSDAAPTEKK